MFIFFLGLGGYDSRAFILIVADHDPEYVLVGLFVGRDDGTWG